MLTRITLKNFKCFEEETSFPLSKINLLTGINGKGKSSLLQSLLLMRQSIEHDERLQQLILNGSCVQLGTIDDIKCSYSSKESTILFRFFAHGKKGEKKVEYTIVENEDDDFIGDIKCNQGKKIGDFPVDFRRIHYIGADRLGPQKFYIKKTMGHFINVGSRGEYVANVLHLKGRNIVNDILYLGKDAHTLEQQTEEWLSEIFGGAKVSLKGIEKESSILTLLLNCDSASEKRYKPSNIGFGYTYILPIVISGLLAAPGEILIVENPEAHLHPRAQSKLTHFLAGVASCGVQVIIESHSEHILNALRICVKNKDFSIADKDVSVLYFQESEDQPVVHIPVKPDGSVDDWPEDFFDQSEKDLQKLIGF